MWTAVSLSLAYGAIFALYGAWAMNRLAGGARLWPMLVALPLVYLVVPLMFVLIWFWIAWWFRADRPADIRLDWRGALRLFWHEFVTIAGNSPRMILFRALMREPDPAPAHLPILLIHGVLCNAGVWYPFKRWLERRGIHPVYALSYGPPLASIDLFADQVAEKVDAILSVTGARKIAVIAHSMGGLVMRAYLKKHGGLKIARLVTVGTPHEGSVHAWLVTGQSVAQMRPRNAWLSELGVPAGEHLPPIVSLWSWHDSMVAPQTSSQVPFGDNIVVSGVGHNALLRDHQVFERLAAEIEKSRPVEISGGEGTKTYQ